ncbi:MAG: putative ATP-binding protein involved in virulence [Parasphingorhabdus sp.]|jgi:predicted ATP-binding protein involved in virulence|uniref:AAA family ATPase n=1 Tax=Parasphingorhabdus sp. TaxID=2709688 RepID=UPI0039E33CCE
MKITNLDVTNLRGFEHASFDLDPSFTLLVGVNGVGKSSVLEALRICLSRVMPKFTASKAIPIAFTEDDTRTGSTALTVRLDFQFADDARHFLMHLPREKYVPDQEGSVRQGAMTLHDQEEMSQPWPKVDKDGSQPLALFFGVRRSHPTDERINIGKTVVGQAVAYADALSTVRALHLADIAFWMIAQEAQAEELPRTRMHLEAVKSAAALFLPTCTDLRATNVAGKPRLLITKGGVELDVRHLSEGERGMLALALDLARRLSQANPGLDDPVSDGVAVVLIDELDMHMHPTWQRKIPMLLTQTFRGCQFVASSHSPQIIGETQPGQLILLKQEDGRIVPQQCGQAYGLDTNYVLEQIMETPSRPAPVLAAIDAVEEALDEADLDLARNKLADLRKLQHGDDPTSVGLEAAINNLEALADEAD